MRTIEEIEASISKIKQADEAAHLPPNETFMKMLDDELRVALTANIPLDRLREICAAERDGRCVVLPCKVGQKVKVRCDTWGNSWNFKTYECGEFLHGEIISIIQTKKQTLMKIQVEHNVSWKRERKRYPVSALGVTVFLLPKAAMKGGGE